MRFNQILLLAFFLLGIGLNSLSAQSPWAKSKGEGFLQLSYTAIPAYDQLISNNLNNRDLEREMSDQTLQSYFEYGFEKKFSIIAFAPIKMLRAGELNTPHNNPVTEAGNLIAYGNVSIGARKGFTFKNLEHSFQIQYEFAATQSRLASGLIGGFNANATSFFYSVGKGFNKNFYAFAFGGPIFRNSGFSNQYRLGFEVGYQLKDKLWTIFYLDHLGLLEENGKILDPRQEANGLFLDEQSYVSPGFKFIYSINKLWFITSGIGGAFSANNLAASPAMSIGIAKEW